MDAPPTTDPNIEATDAAGSPFDEAVRAFDARWDMVAPRDDIELWGPAGPGAASIGIALRWATEGSVVDVTVVEGRIRLSSATTQTPLNLAAASRMLRLPAFEVRLVLQAAVEALHYAREAYRLVDELDNAVAAVLYRERELDRAAGAAGHDVTWLNDPQAQHQRVVDLEAQRDRFAFQHGLSGVTASDLEDDYSLAQDVMLLTQERDDLAAAGLMGWLRAADPPFAPLQGVLRPVTTLWRLGHGIVTYLQHTRSIARALATAQERQRIARELYVAHEALADAQELQAARAEVADLREQVAENLRAASTPARKPAAPAPYSAQHPEGASHPLEPPASGPGQPGLPGRRPEPGSPGL